MTHLTVPILAALASALLLACTCTATLSLMSYEDYLSFVQQKQRQELEEFQRNKRGTRDYCNLFPFNRTITNENGCVGYLPLIGCAGKCLSEQIPYHYTSRYIYYTYACSLHS